MLDVGANSGVPAGFGPVRLNEAVADFMHSESPVSSPVALRPVLPIVAAAFLAIAVFIVDTLVEIDMAVAVLYVAVVLTSLSFCGRPCLAAKMAAMRSSDRRRSAPGSASARSAAGKVSSARRTWASPPATSSAVKP